METNKPATLCWKCAKACGGCSWSDTTFTPVEGWTAIKTTLNGADADSRKVRNIGSYLVIECPQYKDDRSEYKYANGEEAWY